MNINYRDYLQYAYSCLLDSEKEWKLINGTFMAWVAIESYINNIIDDLNSLPSDMFKIHEKAFLEEKRLKFCESGVDIGEFILEGKEYRKLEEKIFFILRRFGKNKIDKVKNDRLWQDFIDFKEMRNILVHPKKSKGAELNYDKVNKYIDTAKEIIQFVSKCIYNERVEF